jgi:hypothetical protein
MVFFDQAHPIAPVWIRPNALQSSTNGESILHLLLKNAREKKKNTAFFDKKKVRTEFFRPNQR